MKKKVWNSTGMKQIIDSGWKEFDRQTNCISTGNVISNTQLSQFIRPYSETECNGFERPKGHLMKFDLESFNRYDIPQRIMNILKDVNRRESYILYMFFTMRNGMVEPFCWVITDELHRLITYNIVYHYGQHLSKRISAAKEAISYITD